ncbi:Transposable element tcb2 transposase [Caligus rogercresseyi]|uniref:Transposable element tcb2 transposase n=1 Tax=Caligus rogercresseyi TaxID=217165 RepID=A0A7T8KKJ3_CALRO|nr:Transposable element tcb2 transposase [Caligus rogercresseyi]
MSEQEMKRQRAIDLLCAQVDPKVITTQIKVSLATVYNIRKAMEGMDLISRKPGTGGHNKNEENIKKDPTKYMRKMAAERNVALITVTRAVHEVLGLKSFVRTPRHLLAATMKARRLERAKKVLNFFKHNGDTVKIYSDKKIFTVDAVLNRRNDRFLAETRGQVEGYYRTKHPAQVMVLGIVASDGRSPGSHVQKVQEFCKGIMASFWPADFWPSSSPDVNPLDFAVWGFLEGKTNKTSHTSVEALKVTITKEWDNISEDFIKTSCASVRPRIEAIIRNNGGHIE